MSFSKKEPHHSPTQAHLILQPFLGIVVIQHKKQKNKITAKDRWALFQP